MKKERLTIGVIGCGNISEVYIPNIMQHCPQIEIAACADMRAEAAEKACEKYAGEDGLIIDDVNTKTAWIWWKTKEEK